MFVKFMEGLGATKILDWVFILFLFFIYLEPGIQIQEVFFALTLQNGIDSMHVTVCYD